MQNEWSIMKKLAIIALLAGMLCNNAQCADTIFDFKGYFTNKYNSAISFFAPKSTPCAAKPVQPSLTEEPEIIFGTFVNQKLMPHPDYSHYKRLACMTVGMTGLFLLFSK